MQNLSIGGLKTYFREGKTLELQFRKEQLRLLMKLVTSYEVRLLQALFNDLGKSAFESYATEIGLLRTEIKRHLRKLDQWARPQHLSTPLAAFPASSAIEHMPYGVSLIISPWNYPVQLALLPLVGAISAGNCVVIKPSEYSSHTAAVLEEMINSNFDPNYIRLVQGDASVSKRLLGEPFDFIFFTGSTKVGQEVMKAAAKQLIPLVLELGGKSPCIVDQSAKIELAARRIIWGKTINAGQSCIAPDYVLVHEKVRNRLVKAMKKEISRQWGNSPITNAEYPKIIAKPQFERLLQLLKGQNILYGGNANAESLKMEPTLIETSSLSETVMQEEIFGPILPVISFTEINQAIEIIHQNPKPLAMYIFTGSKSFVNNIKSNVLCGGITINDTIMHFTNTGLPFGGSGSSGLGSYHGKHSYDAFSHQRSVMKRSNWLDVQLRYPPFKSKLRLLKKIIH
jgi:aldehyde dehydrogenase (NAD+)